MLNQQLADETRGVQNALAEKTDRLTKAREQGVMTEFELQTRLSAITREAIARNPQLPLGLPQDIKIYIDKNVMTREKVFIGGGNRVSKFFLSPETLVRLTNASVEDLT